jgi:hypothetical protein
MKSYYKYILFFLVFIAVLWSSIFSIDGKLFSVLCDDEMISMYYARTLDLSCEGYTNPLWTLIMIPCQLLPKNIASLPIITINLACIFGMMYYSKNPLFLGLTFPLLFWAVRGVEFIPIAFLFFYALKTNKLIIPMILIMLLRSDGFVFAGILLLINFKLEYLYYYLGTLLLIFGIRFLVYQDIFPNTYYLKLGYPLTERISRSFQSQNWIFLLTPYKYVLPIGLIFLYNMFIGGDAWEQYGFLNRFLIITIPLFFEMVNLKELFLVKIVS